MLSLYSHVLPGCLLACPCKRTLLNVAAALCTGQALADAAAGRSGGLPEERGHSIQEGAAWSFGVQRLIASGFPSCGTHHHGTGSNQMMSYCTAVA